jgi:hypothetical protein
MLWRAKTKTELFDYFRESDALRKQYDEVIEKAGIGAAVELCERLAEPYYRQGRQAQSGIRPH